MKSRIEAAVYGQLAGNSGSVSAEHGIGLEKKPWLTASRNEAELALMRTLKRALDPMGILNPGKVFDVEGAATRLTVPARCQPLKI